MDFVPPYNGSWTLASVLKLTVDLCTVVCLRKHCTWVWFIVPDTVKHSLLHTYTQMRTDEGVLMGLSPSTFSMAFCLSLFPLSLSHLLLLVLHHYQMVSMNLLFLVYAHSTKSEVVGRRKVIAQSTPSFPFTQAPIRHSYL